eukprot:7208416-Ditylum_brightwellii.AAC.1
MKFDIRIPTKEGIIFAAYIKQFDPIELANASAEVPPKKVNVNKAHKLLGHSDKNKTKATAKHLGWTITRGKLDTCKSCA